MSKRIAFRNFNDTVGAVMRNDATAPRLYQFPDKDITVAGLVDIPFGVNVSQFDTVQDAIDSVGNDETLNLFFPPGEYSITTPLVISGKGRVNIHSFGAVLVNNLSATGAMFDIDDCFSLNVFWLNFDMNSANTNTVDAINAKDIFGTVKFSNLDFYSYGKEDSVGIRLENASEGSVTQNYGMPGANITMCNFYNDVLVTAPASYDYNSNANKGQGIYLYDQAEYVKITNCSFSGICIGIRLRSGANVIISSCQFTACLPKIGGSYSFGVVFIEPGGTNGGKIQITACNFNHNWSYCVMSTFATTERPVFINNCDFIANGFTCIYMSVSGHDRWMITNNWFDRANMHIGAVNDPFNGSTERYVYTITVRNTVRLNTFLAGVSGACVGSGSPANFNIVKNNNYESGLTVATLNGANNVTADNDVI